MEYTFWKYQGTGNDFIFFDGRQNVSQIKGNADLIARLCDRRFGIGADGLIILEEEEDSDFRMVYYNSDGGESTMCGNGGRCSIAFAKFIGLGGDTTKFEAIDGEHDGRIRGDGWIELGMTDVAKVKRIDEQTFELNTGSPHFVRVLKEDEEIDIVEFGRAIRYNDQYKKEGINVNTIRIKDEGIEVETYERGVEDQTLSCGTGVTACAIAYYEFLNKKVLSKVQILTAGGELSVSFSESNDRYKNIVLAGPAKKVFEGVVDI